MNIFYVDDDPVISAVQLCNKHIVKMPLETAQILSTAHRHLDGDDYADNHGLYKVAHLNHPSTVWARSSKQHYEWLVAHFEALLDEKLRRYTKKPPHKSGELLDALRKVPDNMQTQDFHPHLSVCQTNTRIKALQKRIVTTIVVQKRTWLNGNGRQ